MPTERKSAWHGTAAAPFDQFSDEAIGSGEGAQTFGWGHYVAGKKEVAESYMPGEESLDLRLYDGPWKFAANLGDSHPMNLAHDYLRSNKGDIDSALRSIEQDQSFHKLRKNDEAFHELRNAAGFLHANRSEISATSEKGSLLEVHIL